MAQSTSEDTIAHLTRLSQKPGVQSTLILSRTDGVIVRTSGLLSSEETAESESTRPTDTNGATNKRLSGGRPRSSEGKSGGLKNAEEVARVVWNFFTAAGSAVDQLMGEEDGVKLLRLRTKRNELVVVPDPKFLLVVIHETPPV